MTVTIRPARLEHAAAIAAIWNEGIAGRAATFETAPRTAADLARPIAEGARFPLLVATDADGAVLGWARTGSYRERACYAGVGDFSIYLTGAARGRGLGRALLDALIAASRAAGYWKLVGRVFPFNAASRALCRACGFREVGTYVRHACLDGRWLDVVIVERLLSDTA